MKKTFFGVQVLRGVAALLVLGFHVALGLRDDYGLSPPTGVGFTYLPVPFLGNGGVDLFFLISGFVIVWTTQDAWHQPGAWWRFLEKRATRIFPLYWGLTTGKLLLVLVAPGLFKGSVPWPWNTVASYLLIPSWDAEGHVQPLISAGWTLCYEMFFYYVCALCLAARRPPVRIAVPLFVVLGVAGWFRPPEWNGGAAGALSHLIDPLLLEFAAGMCLAELARRGLVRGGPRPMLVLFALGAIGLLASDLLPIQAEYRDRVLVWGLPACAMFYAAIALERRVAFHRWRAMLLIGDASYSIYLSHVVVMQPLINHAKRLHLSLAGEWAVFVLLLMVGLAFGIAVWWVVERKLIRALLALALPARVAMEGARG